MTSAPVTVIISAMPASTIGVTLSACTWKLVRFRSLRLARALPGFDESNVMGGRIPEPDEV